MALIASAFGFWVAFWHMLGGYHPIGWTGLDDAAHLIVAYGFMLGGIIHGVGVKLNGGHRFSPMWRAIGMTIICADFLFLAAHSPDFRSSATFMYTLAGWLFFQALRSALSDCFRALKGGPQWIV